MCFCNLKFLILFLFLFLQPAIIASTREQGVARALEKIGKKIAKGNTPDSKVIEQILTVIDSSGFDVNDPVYVDGGSGVASLLEIAIQYAPWEIIERLIQLGAQVRGTVFMEASTSRLASATTPLHLALAYGRMDILGRLARTFTDLLNERDDSKRTALEAASANKEWEAVEMLNGIRFEVEGRRGKKRTCSEEPAGASKRSRNYGYTTDDEEDDSSEHDNDSESEDEDNDDEEQCSQSTAATEPSDSPASSQDITGSSPRNPDHNATNAPSEGIYLPGLFRSNPVYLSQTSLD